MYKKVISVSLWGNDIRYIQGAIKNSFLSQKYYPDWEFRIYAESHLHKLLKDIPASVFSPILEWKNGRFWRFLPAFEKDVDIMISRDCDSRIGEREVRCVEDWINSGKKFHTIKDHPSHYDFPILAGMWGVRQGLTLDIKSSIMDWSKDKDAYLVDQLWLSKVWELVKNNCHVSSTNETNWMSEQPTTGKDFIGQGYDENDSPLY